MNFFRLIPFRFHRKTEVGFERVQLIWLLAILAVLGALVGPTLLKKVGAENDIRMKMLLRSFHSANDAYQRHNPAEGYAREIRDLVYSPKKVRYLEDRWLKPALDSFSIVYRAPELFPRQSFSLSARQSHSFLPEKSSFCIDQQGILRTEALQGIAAEPLTADAAGCHGGIEVV